jgi:putative proteasome-type protease
MTYCLAIKLNEGLVFCSDSRTNAGPDVVSVYSKMHRFSVQDDRQIVLMGAGNLATTQAVVTRLNRDIAGDEEETISCLTYLSEIADYVGRISREVQQKYAPGGPDAGFNPEATFILGGQINGQDPELFQIYAEGNYIRPSERSPFLQIGETKYGKPILDRIIDPATPHEIAMRCALVSMDSTIRSSATVGPPIELLFLQRDHLDAPARYKSFERNDDYLVKLRSAWNEKVVRAFSELPPLAEVFAAGE